MRDHVYLLAPGSPAPLEDIALQCADGMLASVAVRRMSCMSFVKILRLPKPYFAVVLILAAYWMAHLEPNRLVLAQMPDLYWMALPGSHHLGLVPIAADYSVPLLDLTHFELEQIDAELWKSLVCSNLLPHHRSRGLDGLHWQFLFAATD